MRYFHYLKISLPLIIFLFLGYFLWRGLDIDPTVVPSALLNQKTPEFNLLSLENPHIRLSNKIFLGHVSLLNVWATWCATCADEYPVLMQIHSENSIALYGLDYKDNRQTALNWISKFGNPYQAIGFDKTGNTAINWGVYGTPETFVIDKNSIIRYKVIGPITMNIWQKKLLPLINNLERN